MRTLRIALAQVNPTVGDIAGNVALIEKWFTKAVTAGADVVAFPELAVTGYPPEDLLHKPAFVDANREAARYLATALRGAVGIFGFVERGSDAKLYNAAAVVSGGKTRGVYRKVQLPNYGVFDEKRYFSAGDEYPVFGVRGVTVGVTICEDAWIGDGPVTAVAARGAEVVVNINA
ncbi:MAG TPA: nitrilase-related carbon-nitrogen hydrolase, partial [Actinomycetota bacterium]|nr:nitrilase-related carbon-nitrogen hydrolase [Actinomycetota bacterium]